MSTQGYVIAKSLKAPQYFTAKSSYDRPVWTSLDEATVYPTAEIAQLCVGKLFKRGSFAARVVSVNEVFTAGLSTIAPPALAAPLSNIPTPDVGDHKMTAGNQEAICDTCDHEPCTCEEVGADDTLTVNNQEIKVHEAILPGSSPETIDDADSSNLCKDCEKQICECSMTTETVAFDELNISDPGQIDDPDRDAGTNVADQPDEKIKVPDSVMKALKSTLDNFNKCSDPDVSHDNVRSSFCMTVAGAVQTLIDDLESGTVAGLKQAQIHITTFMNPITTHISPVATNYILSGGTKVALKDLYAEKWWAKKESEL